MNNTIKDAKAFWEEKVSSSDILKANVTRNGPHGFSSSGSKNNDIDKVDERLDEAKRRTNEELVEVLRKRQSSHSPEPRVMSSLSRNRPGSTSGVSSESYDSSSQAASRESWKNATIATSRAHMERDTASTPPSVYWPCKVTCAHDHPSTVAKMTERMNSLKKVTSKPHPPLRPAISVDFTRKAPKLSHHSPEALLKRRPFSTSAADVITSSNNNKRSLGSIINKVMYRLYTQSSLHKAGHEICAIYWCRHKGSVTL